jgi:hypothetical protein
MEITNPFNRTVFNRPSRSFTSANFGRITSTASEARIIQFGMKLFF